MDKLFNCPCVRNFSEQDCSFPDCEGGWEEVYRKMENRIQELQSKLSEYENKLEIYERAIAIFCREETQFSFPGDKAAIEYFVGQYSEDNY